jgi:hypothetical protein
MKRAIERSRPMDPLPEDEWIRNRIGRLRALRRSVLDVQALRAIDQLIDEAEERLRALGAVRPILLGSPQPPPVRAMRASGQPFSKNHALRIYRPRPPSRSSKPAPKAKALPMSKEAQIRALREQSLDEV